MQGTTGMQGPKIATAKAEKVLKKVNEDDMDSKIKHFGKTAVCISVDDCIEECKSFTAFDPNVETTVCETPDLFTCSDDNLCDVGPRTNLRLCPKSGPQKFVLAQEVNQIGLIIMLV
jgi:hypothetical protein